MIFFLRAQSATDVADDLRCSNLLGAIADKYGGPIVKSLPPLGITRCLLVVILVGLCVLGELCSQIAPVKHIKVRNKVSYGKLCGHDI